MSFQLPSGKIITKSNYECLLMRLKIKLTGRYYLGDFGELKYYVFHCPDHGWQNDYSHGYTDYLCCQAPDCKYQITFGSCPF